MASFFGKVGSKMTETGSKLTNSQTLKKMGDGLKAGAAVSYSAIKTAGAYIRPPEPFCHCQTRLTPPNVSRKKCLR